MPPRKKTGQPASETAKLRAEIAELKAALKAERESKTYRRFQDQIQALREDVQDMREDKDFIGDAISSSVLSIMIQLEFQRRVNRGLVVLAEHLNAYFKGNRSLPDLLSELQLAKDVVQRLADGDQVTNIDDHLEVLCHNIRHAAHRIGRSVLDDFRDREDFNDEEIFTAMGERLAVFGAQLKLVRKYETVSEDDCTCVRARALIRDIQTQFKSGTAFNYQADIVPSSDSEPEDNTLTDLSVADEVRCKLSLKDLD
jgi:hypothetical protein